VRSVFAWSAAGHKQPLACFPKLALQGLLGSKGRRMTYGNISALNGHPGAASPMAEMCRSAAVGLEVGLSDRFARLATVGPDPYAHVADSEKLTFNAPHHLRAKPAVAGHMHVVVGRRAAHRPYGNQYQADQLQEPPFARSGVGGHGAVPEVLLKHDVAHLSSDDVEVIIWLPAIRPALMNCSSGIVS